MRIFLRWLKQQTGGGDCAGIQGDKFVLVILSCFCTDGKISVRINLPLFCTVVPSNICMFLSCRPFVAITTLSTVLVGVELTSVSWLGTTVENKGKLIVLVL